MLLPILGTLYGHDGVGRYIRVTDDALKPFTTTSKSASTGIIDYTVESIPLSEYLARISYGDTVSIEPLFAGFKTGLDLGHFKSNVVTQAMLRSYEHRADTLISLCKRKKEALISTKMHPERTSELVAETEGVLTCWKHLMDTGRIRPTDCVLSGENAKNADTASIPLSDFIERNEILRMRMLNENFVSMPYKMTDEERVALLSAFSG